MCNYSKLFKNSTKWRGRCKMNRARSWWIRSQQEKRRLQLNSSVIVNWISISTGACYSNKSIFSPIICPESRQQSQSQLIINQWQSRIRTLSAGCRCPGRLRLPSRRTGAPRTLRRRPGPPQPCPCLERPPRPRSRHQEFTHMRVGQRKKKKKKDTQGRRVPRESGLGPRAWAAKNSVLPLAHPSKKRKMLIPASTQKHFLKLVLWYSLGHNLKLKLVSKLYQTNPNSRMHCRFLLLGVHHIYALYKLCFTTY